MIRLRCLRRERLGPAPAFVLAAALAGGVAAADEPRGFAVGVLRRDGQLIPFATFDGKHWRNNWPAPALQLTVPINLHSVPSRWWGPPGPRETWQAWVDGAPSTLRIVQPDWVDVHCVRRIALRTDYHASQDIPPNTIQPHPKDGIAVSPPQAIEAIEILPVDGEEAHELVPQLLEAFNRAERTTVSGDRYPVSTRKREDVEPVVEAVYAFGTSGVRTYYVEATRAYRIAGQECSPIAVGTGWFMRAGTAIEPLLMTVDLLDCDRTGANYMLPLGTLRVGQRRFWFAQFSGWNDERYVVVEITAAKVNAVVSTWGGGC